uniref:Uncharacterized protein n=1 Tax=Scophthalmus maximus TaxID=52904 RepID=A0A8D3D5R2_SCOMX
MCCFSTLPSEKAFPHWEHTYGRSPVCTRMWTVTLCAIVKPLPHTVHLNGRSPVWVSLWVRIAPIWEKPFPQSGQTWGFSPVWTLQWCPQSYLRPRFGQWCLNLSSEVGKLFPHLIQRYAAFLHFRSLWPASRVAVRKALPHSEQLYGCSPL